MPKISLFFITIIFVIILFSCQRSHTYNLKSIYGDESLRFKNIVYYQTGEIKLINDRTCDSNAHGNQFEFNSIGILTKYAFLTKCNMGTYVLDFDSTGHYKSMYGNPIVSQDVVVDSEMLTLKWYYSKFPYRNVEIQLSDDGIKFTKAQINEERLNKYIVSTTYRKKITGEQHFYKITKFSGFFTPTDSYCVYYDTVDLTRK